MGSKNASSVLCRPPPISAQVLATAHLCHRFENRKTDFLGYISDFGSVRQGKVRLGYNGIGWISLHLVWLSPRRLGYIKLGLPKGIVGFIYGIGVLLAIFTLATRIRSAI